MAEKYLVEVDDVGTYWYAWPGTGHRRHRVDGPAVIQADGSRAWYQNDQLHRVDGPAVEHADGTRNWYQNGQLHRTGGPAVECANGYRAWYQNYILHRQDGPAVINSDGTEEYWLNGTRHTEESWRAATQPAVEMTVAEIETLLGKRIKVVK